MTDDDRLNYIRAIIRHRAPEVTEVEIVEAFAPDDDDRLPPGITEQVLDVSSALADRMDSLESRLTPGRLN